MKLDSKVKSHALGLYQAAKIAVSVQNSLEVWEVPKARPFLKLNCLTRSDEAAVNMLSSCSRPNYAL